MTAIARGAFWVTVCYSSGPLLVHFCFSTRRHLLRV